MLQWDEPADDEVVRLVAYVKTVFEDDADEDNEEEIQYLQDEQTPNEYLIDVMTVAEAEKIGQEGIFQKVAETLSEKKIVGNDDVIGHHVAWRLMRKGDMTPSEKVAHDINEEVGKEVEVYHINDLRNLH